MKRIAFLAILALSASIVTAQNVGVGTAAPASRATISGNASIGAGYDATAAPTNGAIIEGQVGIGTATPSATARLHVNLGTSTTDGVLLTGAFNAASTVPSLGAGTRLMWYPGKIAFRVGYVTGTQWDNANVGINSFAAGSNTTASGVSSTAFGSATTASGQNSTAFGSLSTASGLNSIAFVGGTASGQGSVALGSGTASGSGSTVLGGATTASGGLSTSMGQATTASGTRSTALGYLGTASGDVSVVSGFNHEAPSFGETVIGIGATTYTVSTNGATQFRAANASDRLFVIGNAIDANGTNTVDASERSDAMVVLKRGNVGIGTSAPNATALLHVDLGASTTNGVLFAGTYNAASTIPNLGASSRLMFYPGKAAFRAGRVTGTEWNDASVGLHSAAFGLNATASGDQSVAMGRNTTASGDHATALGRATTASGNHATAMGFDVTASGSRSTAMGDDTHAESGYETAIGRWNTDYVPASTTGWNSADRLFVVGNGTAAGARSDAMVVLKNGNTGLGTSTPTATLHVDGGIQYVDGNEALGRVLTSDASGNATWSAVNSNTLDGAYDEGGAGAGSIITADAGAVRVQGTDGFGVSGTFGSGATMGTPGAGVRMLFNPRKAAFRAGGVTSTQWNDGVTGNYSVALGYNTVASGSTSTALGAGNTASGSSSTAMGSSNTASGDRSTVMGSMSTASGMESIAMGYSTTANGIRAISIGQTNTASGQNSLAMGFNTTASANTTTTMGSGTTASATGATAMGSGTTASGNNATAMGYQTTASGVRSTAMGLTTAASGDQSIAMGDNTTAESYTETVVGRYNTDYTPNSTSAWNAADRLFVVGNGAVPAARSDAMVILKNGNTGIGTSTPSATLDVDGTFQLVDGTEAANDILRSDANGNASWVAPSSFGMFNTNFQVSGGNLQITDGNGTLSVPMSSFQDADWTTTGNDIYSANSGDVGIGTTTPSQKLDVVGNIEIPTTSTTQGAVYMGSSLFAHGYGSLNTFYGVNAGNLTSTGSGQNVGVGQSSLGALTTGQRNTGVGYRSLATLTSGSFNTALGWDAADAVTTGQYNIAIGYAALTLATSSFDNIAIGTVALQSVTTGGNNIAIGRSALNDVVSGTYNIAIGRDAAQNTTASSNLAIGTGALEFNTTGQYNTIVGSGAGEFTTGSNNTMLGYNANGNAAAVANNVFVGYQAGMQNTGSFNVFLGSGAGYNETGSNKLYINDDGSTFPLIYGDFNAREVAIGNSLGVNVQAPQATLDVHGDVLINDNGGNNDVRIEGDTDPNLFVTDASTDRVGVGTATPGGQFELSLDEGRKPSTNTWTTTSDENLKNVTGAYTSGLDEVLALEPITYYYKNSETRQFADGVLETENVGFSAQQVQEVFPEAVGADDDGYLNFNMHAILVAYVNAFKEQQEHIESLEAELHTIKETLGIQAER